MARYFAIAVREDVMGNVFAETIKEDEWKAKLFNSISDIKTYCGENLILTNIMCINVETLVVEETFL